MSRPDSMLPFTYVARMFGQSKKYCDQGCYAKEDGVTRELSNFVAELSDLFIINYFVLLLKKKGRDLIATLTCSIPEVIPLKRGGVKMGSDTIYSLTLAKKSKKNNIARSGADRTCMISPLDLA